MDGGSRRAARKVVYGMMEFLEGELKNPLICKPEKQDSLEVAIQCLETAFGINVKDVLYKPKEKLTTLVEKAEVNYSIPAPETQSQSTATSTVSSAGGGDGMRFSIHTGPVYNRPMECSEEDAELADDAKCDGNDAMRESKVEEALNFYNRAIELNGNNPVFFCNRAAAYIKLERIDDAIRDCQIALQLQSDYARAYGRMGVAYSAKGKFVDAFLCFILALEFDPGNDSYQKNIQVSSRSILQDIASAQAHAATSPNLQSLLNNPNFIGVVVRNLMQDSTLRQTVTSFLPSILQSSFTGIGSGNLTDYFSQIQEGLAQMFMTPSARATSTEQPSPTGTSASESSEANVTITDTEVDNSDNST